MAVLAKQGTEGSKRILSQLMVFGLDSILNRFLWPVAEMHRRDVCGKPFHS
jgi:hypothetical protein